MPSWVAFAVIGLLEQHFSRLVDYDFTAAMEDELDAIASGNERRTNWLQQLLLRWRARRRRARSPARVASSSSSAATSRSIDARLVNSIKLFDDEEGRAVNVRVGRNGPYLERMIADPDNPGELKPQRANLKDELTPDELTLELAEKAFATPQEGRSLGVDPESGHEIVAKDGRFGPYVTEVLPEPPGGSRRRCARPRRARSRPVRNRAPARCCARWTWRPSRWRTRSSCCRCRACVGVDPATSEEITAQNGRYGPYLKRGTDSRSLATEDQMFTITLDEALKIYAEPKRRGRQGAATPPLRELGSGPGVGEADGDQGRPVRSVRHRR